mgnify:CR=1 FL=1
MDDSVEVVVGNGSVEVVEAALEQAGDVVERRLFRKVLLTVLILAVAVAIVKLIMGKSAGSTRDHAPAESDAPAGT